MAEKEALVLDDRDSWQKLREGDAKAIDRLMKKHYNDLYSYGMKVSFNRSLTKDCIQDLFVKLWQNRENLNQVTFVKTYLLKSLKRKLIKVMNQESRLTDYDSLTEDKVDIVFSPEDILITQQEFSGQKEAMMLALNKLPNRHREAIYLKYYNELSHEQIAEVMLLKPQSVYNLIYEALKLLKDKLHPALVAIALFGCLQGFAFV